MPMKFDIEEADALLGPVSQEGSLLRMHLIFKMFPLAIERIRDLEKALKKISENKTLNCICVNGFKKLVLDHHVDCAWRLATEVLRDGD